VWHMKGIKENGVKQSEGTSVHGNWVRIRHETIVPTMFWTGRPKKTKVEKQLCGNRMQEGDLLARNHTKDKHDCIFSTFKTVGDCLGSVLCRREPVLFSFVQFCSVLFSFVQFCSVLFSFVQFCCKLCAQQHPMVGMA
jgi:hypothetical protein